MREYSDNHRRLFDGGNNLEVAATLRAVFEVNSENALEQPRPVHARRRTVRVFVCGLGAIGPVITIYFGWLILDEPITLIQIIGALLVLAGVLLVSLKVETVAARA